MAVRFLLTPGHRLAVPKNGPRSGEVGCQEAWARSMAAGALAEILRTPTQVDAARSS